MNTEPAQIIGWLTALAAAVVTFSVAFGLDLSEDQQGAVLGLVAVVSPVVAGYLIRSKVWSPASVQQEVNQAAQTGMAQHIVRE